MYENPHILQIRPGKALSRAAAGISSCIRCFPFHLTIVMIKENERSYSNQGGDRYHAE